MRNTFDIAFYCRSSKMNKKGLAPIEMSVSLQGERVFINLPMKMNPEFFGKCVSSKILTGLLVFRSIVAQISTGGIFTKYLLTLRNIRFLTGFEP